MASTAEIPFHYPVGVKFALYSSDEIKKLSVKRITNPETFDSLLHPNYGGLYDPALGPADRDEICDTCGLNSIQCPGHFGHIELPLPVYHPLFVNNMISILRSSCFCCHSLIIPKVDKHIYKSQVKLLEFGLIVEAGELESFAKSLISEHGQRKETEHILVEAINKRVKDILKAVDKKEARKTANTLNVTEFRHDISKNFLATHMVSRRRHCELCKAPSRAVHCQSHAKVYFKGLPKREAQRWATAKVAMTSIKEEPVDDVLEVFEKEATPQKNEPNSVEEEAAKCLQQTLLTPKEARRHLRQVWVKEGDFLNALLGAYKSPRSTHRKSSSEMFFIDTLPVIPTRFRPMSFLGEKRFENPQTANLCKVLKDCELVIDSLKAMNKKVEQTADSKQGIGEKEQQQIEEKDVNGESLLLDGNTPSEILHNAWINLQTDVNCVMDSDLDKSSTNKYPGVRQLLEKKEGLFRKNMMGKRVNFAARSVISPDPYINTDEIGVPEVFATKLTYPQPVTALNVKELRQAVINGPLVHPGAIFVENENGKKTVLSETDAKQRHAVAKRLLTPSDNSKSIVQTCKKVYRHIYNGDVVLLNRQPTLHRPSIMAHKVRVLPNEKTLRLHYSNCKAYNADFDGDEMNAHFPQNEVARAEAYNLASANFHYLVPKDGTPLGGLIQDHIVSGVRMTIRGRMFNRYDYQQLVFNALSFKNEPIKIIKPCIIKPQQLWSGKQVVTTVLINIIPNGLTLLNLKGKSKISPKNWSTDKPNRQFLDMEVLKENDMTESEVIFREGEFLCGVLDKAHYGNTPYGLVHCCYEIYGGVVAGELLTSLSRLFTIFLQLHGFTLGVKDILLTKSADKKRRKFISKVRKCGHEAATKAFHLAEDCDKSVLKDQMQAAHYSFDGSGMKNLDQCVKRKTDHYQNEINKACVPRGLYKRFPENNLQLMVEAGAKGSAVNCVQISCLLGQIELEGRRPPLMLSGRSLPSFLPYDTSPRAGGFVDGRFLTGIRPQEYFFHCMAGREGLVDTAVKTSRSGYLQRCLIKHLEGIQVNYDLTVRDSDGSVVQFYYGEDGLDVLKTRFLSENQYPFIISNYEAFLQNLKPRVLLPHIDKDSAIKAQSKVNKWFKKHTVDKSIRKSPYLMFEKEHANNVKEECDSASTLSFGRSQAQLRVFEMWSSSPKSVKDRYNKLSTRKPPPPVISKLRPDQHFGAVPEKIAMSINSYIQRNPHKCLTNEEDEESTSSDTVDCEKFRMLMNLKTLQSLVEPGEAVGLIAAQSIGEPSTQMTLNTFHFAGRAELNVTLGIPRLREILMTASATIKTPTMDLPLHQTKRANRKAKKLKRQFTRVILSEVLQSVDVWEFLTAKELGTRMRAYQIRFQFLPESQYKDEFYCSSDYVLHYVETVFIKKIIANLIKLNKIKRNQRLIEIGEDKDTQAAPPDEGSEPDDDDDNAELSDDDGVDGGAADVKQRQKLEQHASYDAPDVDEVQIVKEMAPESSDDEDGETHTCESQSTTLVDEELDEPMPSANAAQTDDSGTEPSRQQRVLDSDRHVSSYSCDEEEHRWCEVVIKLPVCRWKVRVTPIIEKLAKQSVIYETPGIRRCFLVDEKDSSYLKTDGVNFQVAHRYADILDVNKLYTNDIHAFANTYGIEAASRVIAKEVKNVFGGYGIHVDPRHLMLVADYMTYEGKIKAFNRIGIESCASPFQKMSFETTTHFLRRAVLSGDTENLKSPSSRLVVGRAVGLGTGCFDLLQRLTLD